MERWKEIPCLPYEGWKSCPWLILGKQILIFWHKVPRTESASCCRPRLMVKSLRYGINKSSCLLVISKQSLASVISKSEGQTSQNAVNYPQIEVLFVEGVAVVPQGLH